MKQWIDILNLLGPIVERAVEAYKKARELAKAAGVPDSELDAADARFLKHYEDPLAGETPEPTPEPTPNNGAPYAQALDDMPTVPPFQSGDHLYKLSDGRWWVEEKKYGIFGTGGKQYQNDLT